MNLYYTLDSPGGDTIAKFTKNEFMVVFADWFGLHSQNIFLAV